MTYAELVEALAGGVAARCGAALNLVLIDGIPAGGKSSLAAALARGLEARGREVATVENDWFIAAAIRSPLAVAGGLARALALGSAAAVEARLLERFLDQGRLSRFQEELRAASARLGETEEVVLHPEGAFWNLRQPRPWALEPAARGLRLRRGAVLLIEGTLTAATYGPRFPDLTRVLVRVPPEVARQRFLARNRDEKRRRNAAFSALALNAAAFRIASEMLERRATDYHFEVDLASLEAPRLHLRDCTL